MIDDTRADNTTLNPLVQWVEDSIFQAASG